MSLLTDPETETIMNATAYGVRSGNPSFYSPWSIEVGLMKVYGNPLPLPLTCLRLQVRLSTILSDSDDGLEITCGSLYYSGDTDLITFMKECYSHSPGTATSAGQFAFSSRLSTWGEAKIPTINQLRKAHHQLRRRRTMSQQEI